MDVDMIFKIAAVGIIVAVLNQLLIRSGREDQDIRRKLHAREKSTDRRGGKGWGRPKYELRERKCPWR